MNLGVSIKRPDPLGKVQPEARSFKQANQVVLLSAVKGGLKIQEHCICFFVLSGYQVLKFGKKVHTVMNRWYFKEAFMVCADIFELNC